MFAILISIYLLLYTKYYIQNYITIFYTQLILFDKCSVYTYYTVLNTVIVWGHVKSLLLLLLLYSAFNIIILGGLIEIISLFCDVFANATILRWHWEWFFYVSNWDETEINVICESQRIYKPQCWKSGLYITFLSAHLVNKGYWLQNLTLQDVLYPGN